MVDFLTLADVPSSVVATAMNVGWHTSSRHPHDHTRILTNIKYWARYLPVNWRGTQTVADRIGPMGRQLQAAAAIICYVNQITVPESMWLERLCAMPMVPIAMNTDAVSWTAHGPRWWGKLAIEKYSSLLNYRGMRSEKSFVIVVTLPVTKWWLTHWCSQGNQHGYDEHPHATALFFDPTAVYLAIHIIHVLVTQARTGKNTPTKKTKTYTVY